MRAMTNPTALAVLLPLLLAATSSCGAQATPEPAEPGNPTAAESSTAGGLAEGSTGDLADGPGDSTAAAATDSEGQWEGEAEAVSKPGAPQKTETRTTAVIQKVVLDNRKPVRDCYDKAKKELPDLKGTMTIKFVLDPEGNVKTAELNIERSDVKAPSVVDCSIEAIKKIKFPPSSRGMDTTVNYPFDFKPGS